MPPRRNDKGKDPASDSQSPRASQNRNRGSRDRDETGSARDKTHETEWTGETESTSSEGSHLPPVVRRTTVRKGVGTSGSADPVNQAVETLLAALQNQNPDQVRRVQEALRPVLGAPASGRTRATTQRAPQPRETTRKTTRGRPRRRGVPEPRAVERDPEELRQPQPQRAEPVVQIIREPIRERNLLTEFLAMQPPSFKGDPDPEQAEDWLAEMEKRFRVLHCNDQQKVEFAVYMLGKTAGRWWQTVMMANPDWERMTWDQFVERFNEEYFPDSVRQQKVCQFDRLRQGQDTVAEYTAKFNELSRFVTWVATNPKERICRFKMGRRKTSGKPC